MEKSQLISLLRTFTKKDIRDCRKWLQSPFHNQREDVLCLFDHLFEQDRLLKEDLLIKQVVYTYIFPDEQYDDAKIRQTMFFLLKSIEKYLSYLEWSKEEVTVSIHLSRAYIEKGLSKYASKTLTAATQKIEDATFRDNLFHQYKYNIIKEEYAILEGQGRSDAQNKLSELINAYRVAYISEELAYACLLYSSPNPNINPIEEDYLKHLLPYIEQLQFNNNQNVSLYLLIYEVLAFNKDNQFDDLKLKLRDYRQFFKSDELRELYLLIINYCIFRVNMTGKREFLGEAFALYKLGIEDGIFIENGILDRYLFRNIVTNGIYLKEYEWVENFIEKYQHYLEPQYKDSFVNFGLGSLYFQTKKYDKAMRYLAQYEHDDVLLNLNSKSMLMRIYYEQKEMNVLESLLDSFKVYLRRKKEVGDNYRLLYNNLIKYTKKLLNVNPYDSDKREKLRQDILATNPLVNKEWFLEQLEKL